MFAGQFIDLLHEERKLVRLAIAGPSNGLNPMLPFSEKLPADVDWLIKD